VLESPHILIVGEGATRFAHKSGFADVVPTSPEAEQRYTDRMKKLRERMSKKGSGEVDWRAIWNFPNPMPAWMKEHGDTVGTVARDREGHFAATLSTGGTSFTLYGRVGDVPIFGAGLYAGPEGAVACTGDGEIIVRQMIARSVYETIASGVPAEKAVAHAVAGFPEGGTIGIIAVDRVGFGVAANKAMAFGVASGEEQDETPEEGGP
jgi:L-asparaginase / beta-aspartyl-peptidase